ncbi:MULTISPECIES: c-type cytochrome [Prochlorococcus]|uniref:c-type cytochrome n=1 Tax=Prochlorococcus TaxID=1218 RepID=UPI0003026658|nr:MULTISPECIES: cytochrome c [Prochlorococcus]KGG13987.1 Cytochrome C [Prochlorococcus marinus str. LG]KGG19120.1 Cytochrome C [Prochlorococcus marinus str. SS2]KGG35690.1 Cytochrome C [Prochlorococcus sp. SS52]
MKSTSSIGAEEKETLLHGLRNLLIISAIACLLIVFFILNNKPPDPYVEKSLNLNGAIEDGNQLFRMNCVGCHGISAQGLVGPELNKVTEELNDKQIINQVINGLTPPMPSFEMDPQSMADLLAYLHSLNN